MRDEDVPEFWRALGLPGLADVHVHFYPERMLRRFRRLPCPGCATSGWPA